jgi:MYXO-CTERM domain-containing protein
MRNSEEDAMQPKVGRLLVGFVQSLGLVLVLAALPSACSKDQPLGLAPEAGSPTQAQSAVVHRFRTSAGAFEAAAGDYRATATPTGVVRLSAPGVARTGAKGSELQVETRAFSRSGGVALGPARVRLRDDGALELDRGPIIEHFQPRQAGIEQSWELAHAPPGVGDLVVSVSVGGLRPLQGAAAAPVFVDDATGALFSYGEAAWIDAAGRRTRVDERYADGAIHITVPAGLVDASSYPAVLDPFIGVAFPLEGTVYVPSSSVGYPSIAGNGTDYLVTWSTGATIYASRVTGAGALLDPTPTIVVTGNANKTRPRAAWDGTEWFVVWGEDTQNYVLARRVRTDGTLVDQQGNDSGLVVASALATSVDVAFDGSEFLVVYAQNDAFAVPHVYGVRVGVNGQRIDTSPLVISNAAYPKKQTSPRVAFDGTEFFVAWADSRASASPSATTWDIYGARVTHGGVLLDGPTDTGGTPISTATGDQTSPAVASDGNVAFVVWSDGRGAAPAYYGARVDPSTGLVDGPASTGGIHVGDGVTTSNAPDVTFDGSKYDVVWSTYGGAPGGVLGARVTAAADGGAPATSPLTVTPGSPVTLDPAIAGGSAGSFIGWMDQRLSSQTLFGTRMNASGTLLDGTTAAPGFCISEEPVSRWNSVAAANGSGFLAAWMDNREGPGSQSIFAERLDGGGTALDTPAFAVAVGRTSIGAMSVGSSGSGYVVTWNERNGAQTELHARFIDSTGTLLNGPATSAGLTLSQSSQYGFTAVAYDGTDYLFVWADGRDYSSSTGTGGALYGLETSATGVVRAFDGSADGSFPVVTSSTSWSPSGEMLDFDGTNFLLVWTGQYGALMGSRLAPDGTRLDGAIGASGFTIQTASYSATAYGLAYDGANHLVLSSDGSSLFARAISKSGAVSGPGWTLGGVSSGLLTYDGSVFWALWAAPAGYSGIQGVRLRGDGSARDTTPLSIDGTSNDRLAAAAGMSGEALVTFGMGSDTDGVIVLDDAANGITCTSGTTCASGVCEDGVCCDRPCGGSTPDCQACSTTAGAAQNGVCGLAAAASVCRPSAGACDVAEVCDGVSTACAADRFLRINTTCQAASECASSSVCTGTSASCPAPALVASGTRCDGGTCAGGACVVPVEAGPEGGADAGADATVDAAHDGAAPAPDAPGSGSTDASADGASQGSGSGDAIAPPLVPEAGQEASATPPEAGGEADASGTADMDGGPEAGVEGASAASGSKGGCSCRVGPEPPPTGAPWSLAALSIAGVLRKRRR